MMSCVKTIVAKFIKSCMPRSFKVRIKAWLDPELATARDLRSCYRLLLGRKPDREGWRAFMASIRDGAMTRRRLVRTFLESAEFRGVSAAGAYSHDLPAFVALQDFGIYVNDPESSVGRAICHDRVYEPEVTAAMTGCLQPGMTVIDAGANIGYFSLLAARKVGEYGTVHAFDPSPFNCDLLRRSARENGFCNIIVHDKPLADKVARYAFFEQGGNGMLLEIDPHKEAPVCDALVTTALLDDYLDDISRVDVIKLDVEGAEHLVMCGAKKLLERDRPVILTEFTPGALTHISRVAPEHYIDYLLQYGYRISVLASGKPPLEIEKPSGAAVMRLWEHGRQEHLNLMFTTVR